MKYACKIIFYVIVASLTSYLTFFAFQGVLNSFTRIGNTSLIGLVGDYAFNYFELFLMPATMVYLYRALFVEKKYLRSFHRNNGIYHIVMASICFSFNIWAIVRFKNWGRGATYLYPVDFLVFNVIALFVGIFSVIKSEKENVTQKTKLKSRKAFSNIFVYAFSLMALDRFGVIINSFLSGNILGGPLLLPIYLLCLCPVLGVLSYFLFRQIKNTVKKNRTWLYSSWVVLLCTVGSFAYELGMLYSPVATKFMKIISPFYGADRLISKPITLILIPALLIIPTTYSLVLFYSSRRKLVETVKVELPNDTLNQEKPSTNEPVENK